MNTIETLRGVARPLVLALGAAALASTLAGCSDATGKVAAAAPASAPVSASTVLVKQIAETQEFSGRLEAVERVDIRPRVSGYITAVKFTPGAEVKKGEVLFVIDARPYQAEADRAEAAARSAGAKAALARLELARAERLLAEKAIPQREYDERASSQAELEANARAAQAQYEAAKLNLTYTRVTSPIDGRVSKAEITFGNLVDASAVLTSVVSIDRIYASFDGDEATYLRVGTQNHKGQPVAVMVGLANEEGFPHKGKLEFVDNQLNTQTGSVRMRATFENRDRALVPGLFARVQLGGGSATSNAILIDDRAVGTDQNRKFVYVVDKDSKAEYRAVKLGPTVDGLRVVKEGLKAGESIVVNGLQRVRPGAPLAAEMVSMHADSKPGADATMPDKAGKVASVTGVKE